MNEAQPSDSVASSGDGVGDSVLAFVPARRQGLLVFRQVGLESCGEGSRDESVMSLGGCCGTEGWRLLGRDEPALVGAEAAFSRGRTAATRLGGRSRSAPDR